MSFPLGGFEVAALVKLEALERQSQFAYFPVLGTAFEIFECSGQQLAFRQQDSHVSTLRASILQQFYPQFQ
jgi:hypothetical protein